MKHIWFIIIVQGSSKALKSVCIGHNCELSEADVRKLLEENEIGTDR